MSEIKISIPTSTWVYIPELDVEVRHDEVITKTVFYNTENDIFLLRETPWQVRSSPAIRSFEACEQGNKHGECVLENGHDKDNHIDRYGKEWNVANGQSETPSTS